MADTEAVERPLPATLGNCDWCQLQSERVWLGAYNICPTCYAKLRHELALIGMEYAAQGREREAASIAKALVALTRTPPIDVEAVARAIANAMDVDPDVFSGMHGRRLWEKQWLPIAEAAIAAMRANEEKS